MIDEYVPIKKRKNNNKKIIFLISIIIFILIIYIVISHFYFYQLILKGDSNITININDNYHDKGCKIVDKSGLFIVAKSKTKTNLNTNHIGTYYMTCNYKNISRTRYIHVIDNNDYNMKILDDNGESLSKIYQDKCYDETTIFKISYDNNITNFKYCIASLGDVCKPNIEANSLDTFAIHKKGKKIIYMEANDNDKPINSVSYLNIK